MAPLSSTSLEQRAGDAELLRRRAHLDRLTKGDLLGDREVGLAEQDEAKKL